MKKYFILIPLIAIGTIVFTLTYFKNHNSIAESNRLVFHGNIDIRTVKLAFNASERISNIFVQEGDRVTNGQLLAKLDSYRYELALSNITAQMIAQREILKKLETGSRPEEIDKAKAEFDAARVELENAEQNFNRVQKLLAENVATPQQYDDAMARLNAAKARFNAFKKAYELVRIGPRSEDIEAARANLNSIIARYELAKRELKDTELYSPTDGIIENRLLEIGDMASPQKPVFSIALDNPLWVRAYVGEHDLGKIKYGQKALIKSDSFPDKTYEGWIGYISPVSEFTPKSVETIEVRTKLVYQIRVFVKDHNNELRQGMPVTVFVTLDESATLKNKVH